MVMTRLTRAAACVLLSAGLAAGCDNGAAGDPSSAPSAKPSNWFAPGIQPNEDLKSDGAERAVVAIMEPILNVGGVRLSETKTEYADDVASAVCGTRAGPGIYESRDGQRRSWDGGGLEVEQLVGVFGTVTAAEAVTQVKGFLGCGSYRDRDGEHRLIAETVLPEIKGIDGGLMFCDVINGSRHSCTALLSREDILTRIQVFGSDETRVRQVCGALVDVASKTLTAAW